MEVKFIKYWKTEQARKMGQPEVFPQGFSDLTAAIQMAQTLVTEEGFACAEVQANMGKSTYYHISKEGECLSENGNLTACYYKKVV